MPKRGAKAGVFGTRSRQQAVRRRRYGRGFSPNATILLADVAALSAIPTPAVANDSIFTLTTAAATTTAPTPDVVATSTFLPSDLANLFCWYDFSDISTLFTDTGWTTPVTADGDTIGSLTDKGPDSRDMVKGAVGPIYKTNILNGLSVGRLTVAGTASMSSAAAQTQAQPLTVMQVLRFRTTPADHPANIELFGAVNDQPQLGTSKATNRITSNAGSNISDTTPITTTDTYCAITVWSGASSLIRVGDVETAGDAGALGYATDTLRFGQGAQDTDQGETAVWSRALDVGERDQLVAYARAKWDAA